MVSNLAGEDSVVGAVVVWWCSGGVFVVVR
jgi:hypothetical protein